MFLIGLSPDAGYNDTTITPIITREQVLLDLSNEHNDKRGEWKIVTIKFHSKLSSFFAKVQPGVNFANILQASVLYKSVFRSFYVLTV